MTAQPSQNTSTPVPPPSETINLRDFFGFLIGNRNSIEKVLAASKLNAQGALLFGAVLVATVALARSYDTVSLVSRPERLTGPFIASLIMCVVLFLSYLFWLTATNKSREPRFDGEHFLKFLIGYWWTAPIAWLYAIPVETFTEEVTAVRLNLAALSVVSIWRVLLFSRVASILFGIRFWTSLLWILLPCMVAGVLGTIGTHFSIVPIMGGIDITSAQQLVLDYSSTVGKILIWSFLPLLCVTPYFSGKPADRQESFEKARSRSTVLSPSLWILPIMAFTILVGMCFYFQPRIRNANRVDSLIYRQNFEDAFKEMDRLGRENFLSSWSPRPVIYHHNIDPLRKSIDALIAFHPERWVAQSMLENAERKLIRFRNGIRLGSSSRTELFEKKLGNFEIEELTTLQSDLIKLQGLRTNYKMEVAECNELLALVEAEIAKRQSSSTLPTDPSTRENSN